MVDNSSRESNRESSKVNTPTPARAGALPPDPDRQTFVLDTSVLLSDPGALVRFAEHDVVLPLVVVSELEGKRHHPELGYFAREALRRLDDLRVEHGRLDAPMPIGEAGGTLRVELNHSDTAGLPSSLRSGPLATAGTPGSSRSPRTSPRRGTASPSSPRTSRCASRRRPSA